MLPYAERIMNARASCTYGTSQNVRKNISNNVRTDTWGIYAIRGGTVISIQRVNPELPMDDPSQPVYGNNIIIQDVDGFMSKNAIINPASYIKSGTYPCNTEISTPYKWPIGKTKYLHEGTDFSGLYARLLKDWQKGLLGKETIDAQK